MTRVMAQRNIDLLSQQAQNCRACELSNSRTTVVFGSGSESPEVVVIGEAPGEAEDLTGEPFVGRSGQLLERLIGEELKKTRAEIYITNVVKCRPPKNRDPKRDEIAACHDFLLRQLELLEPHVILSVGNFATRAVLNTKKGITEIHGTTQTSELSSAPVIPTFHPAAALRGGPRVVAMMREDLSVVRGILERAT